MEMVSLELEKEQVELTSYFIMEVELQIQTENFGLRTPTLQITGSSTQGRIAWVVRFLKIYPLMEYY